MFNHFLLIWKKRESPLEVWGQTQLQHSEDKAVKTNCRSLLTLGDGASWGGLLRKPTGLYHQECDLSVVGAHPLEVFLEERNHSNFGHCPPIILFLNDLQSHIYVCQNNHPPINCSVHKLLLRTFGSETSVSVTATVRKLLFRFPQTNMLTCI